MVKDSRLTPENFMRRRRECTSCGKRFTTWESTGRPSNTAARRAYKQAYDRARYASLTQEDKELLARKRQARLESKITGKPLREVHAQWGIQ